MDDIIFIRWLFQETIGQKAANYRPELGLWRKLSQIIDHGQFNLKEPLGNCVKKIQGKFRKSLIDMVLI